MFFSMPVRQKCIKELLEVEHIRQMVQQIALVSPYISFVVENSTTGLSIVKSKKVQSTLERISHFYNHGMAKNMKLVEYKADSYHVNGYLSTELSSSKSLQLVYVNRRLVSQNQIHALLENLLIHQMCSRTERLYPQYLMTIQCFPSDCDFYYQPTKTFVEFVDWPTVLKVIAVAAKNVISSTVMYSDNLAEGIHNRDDASSNDCVTSHEVTSIHFLHGMQSRRVQKSASLTNDAATCGSISDNSRLHKFIGVKTVSRSPLHTSSIAQKLTQFSNERKVIPVCNSSFKLPKYPTSDVLISPFMPLDHSTPLQTLHSSNTPNNTNKHISRNCSTGHHAELSLNSKPLLTGMSHDAASGKRQALSSPGHVMNSGIEQLPHSNPVEKLLLEWNNPVFKTGQEVM